MKIEDVAYEWYRGHQLLAEAGDALNKRKQRRAIRALHAALYHQGQILMKVIPNLSGAVRELETNVEQHGEWLKKAMLGVKMTKPGGENDPS